ncbi:MAG: T9SS type A sorting domain-containing protein, partial [Candidatus Fermentibacteraceae bacterium]|nr:T9SS type A sorting domain-containing protein [Candidatus Fermentibacteraceae bacterium]
PNPFSMSSMLSFELSNAGHVRLDVYDVSGRIVENLADGEMASGPHTLEIDGSGLIPGVYMVRLQSGIQQETVMIVLVR